MLCRLAVDRRADLRSPRPVAIEFRPQGTQLGLSRTQRDREQHQFVEREQRFEIRPQVDRTIRHGRVQETATVDDSPQRVARGCDAGGQLAFGRTDLHDESRRTRRDGHHMKLRLVEYEVRTASGDRRHEMSCNRPTGVTKQRNKALQPTGELRLGGCHGPHRVYSA